jgi:hypothetical protein
MISMASLYERILNRRNTGDDRRHEGQSMRSFRLWLRKAWEESEKGMEYRRELAVRAREVNQ